MIHKETITLDGKEVEEFGAINEADILNPKLMAPRCKALHARYFNLLKRTKGMVGYDKIQYFDEIIAELEAMGVEFEYICRM